MNMPQYVSPLLFVADRDRPQYFITGKSTFVNILVHVSWWPCEDIYLKYILRGVIAGSSTCTCSILIADAKSVFK